MAGSEAMLESSGKIAVIVNSHLSSAATSCSYLHIQLGQTQDVSTIRGYPRSGLTKQHSILQCPMPDCGTSRKDIQNLTQHTA